MFRLVLSAAIVVATTGSLSAATCAGSDPTIASVAVKNVTQTAGLNNYDIQGTVTNASGTAQPKNLLQSVDVYLGSEKLDAKSIPPLGPGQSATFDYTFQRSKDAGTGTTTLHFVVDLHNGAADCAANAHTNDVTF